MPTGRAQQPVTVGTLQETLLLPLYARAVETRQQEPLLRDPHAVATVEQLAYDFSRFRDPARLRGLAVRTAIIDEIARQFMRQHPSCTVVEIGAGLNARFERLDQGRVRWFDLDLPDVAALRRRFFVETSRRTLIASSLLDPEWLGVVEADGGPPFLLVAEGVLPYLTAEEVKIAFRQVARSLQRARCAFDSVAAGVLPQRGRTVAKGLKARLAWTCDDPREIERWDSRYRLLESWSMTTLPAAIEYRLPSSYRLVRALMRVLDRDEGPGFRVNVLGLDARSDGR